MSNLAPTLEPWLVCHGRLVYHQTNPELFVFWDHSQIYPTDGVLIAVRLFQGGYAQVSQKECACSYVGQALVEAKGWVADGYPDGFPDSEVAT